MESSQFKPQDFNSGHYTFEHIWDTAVISEFSDQINDLYAYLPSTPVPPTQLGEFDYEIQDDDVLWYPSDSESEIYRLHSPSSSQLDLITPTIGMENDSGLGLKYQTFQCQRLSQWTQTEGGLMETKSTQTEDEFFQLRQKVEELSSKSENEDSVPIENSDVQKVAYTEILVNRSDPQSSVLPAVDASDDLDDPDYELPADSPRRSERQRLKKPKEFPDYPLPLIKATFKKKCPKLRIYDAALHFSTGLTTTLVTELVRQICAEWRKERTGQTRIEPADITEEKLQSFLDRNFTSMSKSRRKFKVA